MCGYEIYNSYFSKEPKNLVTYHKATPSTANDSTLNINKSTPDNGLATEPVSKEDISDITGYGDKDSSVSVNCKNIRTAVNESAVRIFFFSL